MKKENIFMAVQSTIYMYISLSRLICLWSIKSSGSHIDNPFIQCLLSTFNKKTVGVGEEMCIHSSLRF